MADVKDIADLIGIEHRKALRTRLLCYLDKEYPQKITTDLLYACDNDTSENDIDRELAYLEEKHLIARQSPRAGKVLANKITARGRDFLDGHIEEVGLASPAMCRRK